MIKSNIKKVFHTEIDRIWNIVTDNSNYSWRSDISRIEIIDDNHFIEYTKKDYKTSFTITKKIPLKQYQFSFLNTNIKGNWIGIFRQISDNTVELDFTEEIETNNILMKLLAKPYLKNQQKKYLKDLELELKD